MCQLCILKTISQTSRWPKPLEPLISDLDLLVSTAHSELGPLKPSATATATATATASTTSATSPHQQNNSSTPSPTTTNPHSPITHLLTILLDIKTLLEVLEDERSTWWKSKANDRKHWRDTYQQDKITKLNVVNNKTVEMIEGCKVRLGGFCRWGLGIEGGVEGLGKKRKG